MFLAPLLLAAGAATPAATETALTPFLPVLDPLAPRAAAEEAAPADRRTRFSILLGSRQFDEDQWEPLDTQGTLELGLEWRLRDSFIGFEFGTAFSYDSDDVLGVDVDVGTFELFGGVRATADLADGHLRPYLGVGPSLIFTDVTGELSGIEVSDKDSSLGLYVRAGVQYVFDGGFGLGLDYRRLMGTDVTLFDVDADLDFDQIALALSFGF